MSVSTRQFSKAIVSAGLLSADEIRAIWQSLSPAELTQAAQPFAQTLINRGILTPFQTEVLLSSSNTPLVLNDYVLQARIGAGGMGQVFKARHRRMKRLAAIKLLPPALTHDEAAIKRFEREVEAAARLSHPNIVQTYDAGVQQGIWYLVMEYVEGRDLAGVVAAEGPVSLLHAVDYVRQVARGLAYAHKSGVIHRDIKPANLLLDQAGIVKILDMGLARFEGGQAVKDGLTTSGQMMGTVDYMAPEQAFDVHNADARADIYSLGCTLYRLLTNRNLYDGESLVQKLVAHQTKPIPSLAAARPETPPSLVTIFERMVAKRPEDRFQSIADVDAALANFAPPTRSNSTSNNPATDSQLTSFFQSMTGSIYPKADEAAPAATVSLRAAPSTNELTPTVHFSHSQQATDLVPSISIHVARENTPPPSRGNHRPLNRKRKLLIPFVGVSLLLFCCSLWIIIRARDSNHERITVPNDETALVELSDDQTNRPPITNNALKFDGSARVELPLFPATPKTATLEAWIRVTRNQNSAIVATGPLALKLSDRCQARATTTHTRGYEVFYADKPVELDRMVHIALNLEDGFVTLFVDGEPQSQRGQVKIVSDWRHSIGAYEDLSWGFKGTIDEVRISKSARYEGKFKPQIRFEPDADTLALYHFDEGEGDVLTDSSGHGHHGKIIGANWVRADGSPITLSP